MADSEHVGATEVHTRFLHPFRWAVPPREDGKAPAVENLVARLQRVSFRDQIVWEPIMRDHRDVYRAELHEHVANFLFPERTGGGCGCVRMCDNVVNKLFGHRLHVQDSKKTPQPWQLEPKAKVEVFLSPHNVGLLSICLACQSSEPLTFELVQEFNYRLAQQREAMRCWLSWPHPLEDAAPGKAISEENRARMRPAPAPNAGLIERLGSPGGRFSLVELKDWLLEPFREVALIEPRRQFLIFSVVRCPQQSPLDSQRDYWAAKAADLAQIHEPRHAGTPLGAPTVACSLLNRCHWAAASSLGAAHIVADQGVPFDTQRVPTVRDKYFVPFLLAMFQAHYYEDTAAQLGQRSLKQPETCSDELSRGWLTFLEFDGQCNHTYISERQVVNDWYTLARAGLSVAAAHDRLSQVLRELDGFCRLRAAQESREKLAVTAERAEQSVTAIKHTQEKIEWVEIFLIGVYSVYLIHYLGEDFHFNETVLQLGSFQLDYVGSCLLIGTLLASVVAACLLKPWKAHRPESQRVGHNARRLFSRSGFRWVIISVLVVVSLVAYVWEGRRLREDPKGGNSSKPPVTEQTKP